VRRAPKLSIRRKNVPCGRTFSAVDTEGHTWFFTPPKADERAQKDFDCNPSRFLGRRRRELQVLIEAASPASYTYPLAERTVTFPRRVVRRDHYAAFRPGNFGELRRRAPI
jgi:hypothetical protein